MGKLHVKGWGWGGVRNSLAKSGLAAPCKSVLRISPKIDPRSLPAKFKPDKTFLQWVGWGKVACQGLGGGGESQAACKSESESYCKKWSSSTLQKWSRISLATLL